MDYDLDLEKILVIKEEEQFDEKTLRFLFEVMDQRGKINASPETRKNQRTPAGQ